MNRLSLAVALGTAFVLSACGDGLDIPRKPTHLIYDGGTGDIPIPNDVLFASNAAVINLDATLNFPPAGSAAQQALFDALNSLDGWSTTARLSFHFSNSVDPTSLVGGDSVRLFRVDALVHPQTGLKLGTPVSDVLEELASGVDYEVVPDPADASDSSWNVQPLKPLLPKSIYMLVVTNGVLDYQGYPVEAGSSYALAKWDVTYPPDHPVKALQALVSAMEAVASSDVDVSPLIAKEDIVMAMSFTTQSTFDALAATQLVSMGMEQLVLDDLCAAAPGAGHLACTATPANTVPTGALVMAAGNTDSFDVSGDDLYSGHADIYRASLTLPYYLTAAPNPIGDLVQSTAPLTERWRSRFSFLEGVAGADPMETEYNVTRYNPLPIETGAEIVPVLISLPNAMSAQVQPLDGWPVVIFQHGITRNRTDLITQADSFADKGFAAIAIDLPLHGISEDPGGMPPPPALFEGFTEGLLRERTFGLDLVTQDAFGNVTAAVPDGTADSSGAHFINLSSLQTQRDNLRQAVADLFAVVKMIQDNLDVDGVGQVNDFDPTRIHFVGHSLGAIVGTTFLALDAAGPASAISATLVAPGGGIPRLLESSVTLGPPVLGGLAAAGLDPGTPEFDFFMFAAQSLVDSGDPINFCSTLNGGSPPVFLQEIVGGGAGGGLPDQVVPNSVPDAPLSGTDPMIAELGLTVISASTTTSAAAVRFSEGLHQSLLSPDPLLTMDLEDALAYDEIRMQIAEWLASIASGPMVTITDSSVIAP